jgi:hypothetical protein
MPTSAPTDEEVGEQLFALVRAARAAGVDAEAALRSHVGRVEQAAASGSGAVG